MISFEQAVLKLRTQPEYSQLLYDSYLDGDLVGAGRRFEASGEFAETLKAIGRTRARGVIIDLGAGTGIASFAFARSGATTVYAVEPDPSNEVGRGAIARLCQGLNVRLVAACGESIPIDAGLADVVYARQVLHHARDLNALLRECARVLKAGGVFLGTREHVVDDEDQLQTFLGAHPIHQLAGCEGAYSLERYIGAIADAGLNLKQVFGPWESVVNAYPSARNHWDVIRRRAAATGSRLPYVPLIAAVMPVMRDGLQIRLNREADTVPGRLYTFVATKPAEGA